tara:strand:+ start:269 stop:607 length:339 start_codon:yes stop_codon:yes gene_type:complete
MKMNMIKRDRDYSADPRFKKGDTVGRLTIIEYLGRQDNPNGTPGLQHLYEIECECGEEIKWFQTDLIRKRVGVIECTDCRIERNLKRKEARKKGPITSGNITPKNVLSRPWK